MIKNGRLIAVRRLFVCRPIYVRAPFSTYQENIKFAGDVCCWVGLFGIILWKSAVCLDEIVVDLAVNVVSSSTRQLTSILFNACSVHIADVDATQLDRLVASRRVRDVNWTWCLVLLIIVQKTSQFKTAYNDDSGYITPLKQQKWKRWYYLAQRIAV